jgi:iron uptake system EfeUOB component EfeO/EfeM
MEVGMLRSVDRRRLPGRWWVYGAAMLVLLGAATFVVVDVTTARHSVTLDEKACGAGWSGPVVGRQHLTLHDTADNTVQVFLIDPGRNLVYAEARDVTPGTERAMSTTLGAGRYALRCVFSDGTVLTSGAHTLTGAVAGAVPGLPPMPDLDLAPAVTAYRAYVRGSLPTLLTAATRLAADVTAGNLAAARADWLPAHLDYERLGAAYNSFEDFDGDLNGMAAGLPKSVDDPSWTGFFRIEYGLWHGQSAPTLKPLTDGVVTDVHALIEDFPSEDVDPVDLPLRTHEILENALQFQLSGVADYGSGSTLATIYANTQGTEAVLGTLNALIVSRAPALRTSIAAGLATVQAALVSCRDAHGGWIAVGQLPKPRRQQLDAALDALLEQLARIPNLLQERTSA